MKIYVLIFLLICAAIVSLIIFHEKTTTLTGKDGLIDVETICGRTAAVNKDDYINAKPLVSADITLRQGKTYLYRSDDTFLLIKADEYVLLETSDFNDDMSKAAGYEINSTGSGTYILIGRTAYKGSISLSNGVLRFKSTGVM